MLRFIKVKEKIQIYEESGEIEIPETTCTFSIDENIGEAKMCVGGDKIDAIWMRERMSIKSIGKFI